MGLTQHQEIELLFAGLVTPNRHCEPVRAWQSLGSEIASVVPPSQ